MIKNEFVANYKQYHIYCVTDAVGQKFYHASSPYLTDGYVTVVGKSVDEIQKQIDGVYQRIRLIHLAERARK